MVESSMSMAAMEIDLRRELSEEGRLAFAPFLRRRGTLKRFFEDRRYGFTEPREGDEDVSGRFETFSAR